MAKQTFNVYHISRPQQPYKIEATSMANAVKKSGWAKEEVVLVAALKPAPTSQCELFTSGKIAFYPETGGEIVGTEEQVNAVLAMMGYHGVRVRTLRLLKSF